MMCQNCGENEANAKYTQIINGVKKQMNLCDKCAKELGIDNISFNMPMNFSNFLGDIFEDMEQDFIPSLIKPETLLCDKCKMSYEDFLENGKFGCDNCYDTFENKIDALLKNIHGVNRHVGRNGRMIGENKNVNNIENNKITEQKDKVNKEDKKQAKIYELQARLKQEIKEERYEDAAKTRDEIKKLNDNK